MRRGDLVVVAILFVFGGFIAYNVVLSPRWKASAPDIAVPASSAAASVPNEVVVTASALAAPERNVEFIRRRLQDRSYGSFIGEVLASRDSLLARANRIELETWRVGFLTRVRENVRILQRAEEWLGESG